MKTLPTSPLIGLSEAIYQHIDQLCKGYDPVADICIRGWDAQLVNIISEKLKRLSIACVVTAPSLVATEDIAGGYQRATVKILIESNPLLQPQSGANSWSAYDLASLISGEMDGSTANVSGVKLVSDEIRVKSIEQSRNGTNETASISLETLIQL